MRILVVDDNKSAATAWVKYLAKAGETAEALFDGASAIERIKADPPDLVVTDLHMEPVSGMEVLHAAREQRPPVEVIVYTGVGGVTDAVKAMQLGARDFLTKPLRIEQILARVQDIRTPPPPPPPPGPGTPREPFHAESAASKNLLRTLRRVAEVDSHVWLEGEVGSGRGHAALTIHQHGKQAKLPFVTIDLAHDFTWPVGGTALLPNVDELPDDLQRELVRKLHAAPPELRVIASAGPNARRKVADGQLRPDLYFHLAVVTITVPPLRERPEDILPILKIALARSAARYRRDVPVPAPHQIERLTRHAWPGNIRELLNVAERAVVMGPEALDLEVQQPMASPGMPVLEPGFDLADWLETMERRVLVEALRRSRGDRNAAGRLLNVERNTLRYKLNKYGLLD